MAHALCMLLLLGTEAQRIAWTYQTGGPGSEQQNANSLLALDPWGNLVLAGDTQGNFLVPLVGTRDLWVIKLDQQSVRQWGVQFDVSSYLEPKSVRVDSLGDVVVTGITDGVLASGSLPTNTHAGGFDVFVMKLSGATGALQWAGMWGTTADDFGWAVAVDASDNILVGGHSAGSMFAGNAGAEDLIAMKLGTDGAVQWQQQYGSTGSDKTGNCDVDAATGDLYLTGQAWASILGVGYGGLADIFLLKLLGASGVNSWIVSAGTAQHEFGVAIKVVADGVLLGGFTDGDFLGETNQGGYDAVMQKWSKTGNLMWQKQFGTSVYDAVDAFAVDESGSIIVGGNTMGSMEGTCGARGSMDWFLMGLDYNGQEQWKMQIGSNVSDDLRTIALDAAGNLYVSGFTAGVLGANSSGSTDVVVMKVQLREWVVQYGSTGSDALLGMAVTPRSEVLLAGATYGSVNGQSYQGNLDAYVMMLDASGALRWTWQGLSADSDVAYAVAVDPRGSNVVVVGATGATSNLFVRRLSETTGSLLGQYDIGSAANDAATGVTYSTTSYVYVVGWTDGTISASIGLRDVVVIRLSTSLGYDWLIQTGTTAADEPVACVADDLNNLYIAGWTEGAMEGATAGGQDVFVQKLNSQGEVQWTLQTGTAAHEKATAMVMDPFGYLIVGGWTGGAMAGSSAGGLDHFVMKLNSAGQTQWTVQRGSAQDDMLYALHANETEVVVAGTALDSSSNQDMVVYLLDTAGNLQWAGMKWGTAQGDWAKAVWVPNGADHVLVAGSTEGTLPSQTSVGSMDIFLAKVIPLQKFRKDTTEEWLHQIGTAADDIPVGVRMDSCGDVLVAGSTKGAFTGSNLGLDDIFAVKLDILTGAILWSFQTGTTSEDLALGGVRLDVSGSLIIAGQTTGDLSGANAGGRDMVVIKLSAAGVQQWIYQTGTSQDDVSGGLAVDSSGNVVVGGSTYGSFPVPAGQPWQPNAGQKDIVLIYLDPAGGFKWSFQLGSTQNDTVSACETDAWGNVYAAGRSDVCLRSPSSSTCTHREYGDLFVIKLDSAGSHLWTFMDTNRYTSGTYTWFQAGYRDEDAKAMRFLDRSVGNSWEITWKKEPRNLVVVGYGADPSGGTEGLMFLRNFTQLPTSPSSNSWWLDENVQYDLMEKLDSSVLILQNQDIVFARSEAAALKMAIYRRREENIATTGVPNSLTTFERLGGTGTEQVDGVADDWVDGVLVVGRTSGSYGAAAAGGMDVFVQKVYPPAFVPASSTTTTSSTSTTSSSTSSTSSSSTSTSSTSTSSSTSSSSTASSTISSSSTSHTSSSSTITTSSTLSSTSSSTSSTASTHTSTSSSQTATSYTQTSRTDTSSTATTSTASTVTLTNTTSSTMTTQTTTTGTSSTSSTVSVTSTSRTITSLTQSTTTTQTTSSTTQSTTTVLPLVNALAKLAGDKLDLAASVVESIGNDTGGLLRQVVDVRPDGTVLVGTAMSYNQGQPVAFSHQGVEVEVPSALLEGVSGLGPVAAVMGLMSTEGETFQTLNSSVSGGLQAGVISLDIYVNGTAVRDLTAPILLTLQGTPVARPSCAFWDEVEMVWSTQGLTVVAVENGTIVCSTTHLSIFSSILFTFTCSNAGAIYSLEGVESLSSRPWFWEPAALLNWVTLLVGILLLLWAHGADVRHHARMKEARSMQELQKNDERQDQADEVAEEFGAFLLGGLCRIALSQMVRKETGFSIRELKQVYDRMGHTVLHSRAEARLQRFSRLSCGRRLVMWYALNCRWINFVFLSSKSSCMVRCAVLLGKIYSSWAVSAVFYGSTAIAPGQEDGCTPPEGLLDQLVRSAVVMLVSVFFGALPFLVMLRLFHCATPGGMAGKKLIFWGFLFLYFVFCILTVCIFIALVGTADATKWFLTSALDIAVSLVQPMVIAQLLLVATLCQNGGGHPHAAHSALPWPAAESLENYEVTFQALNVIDRFERKKRRRYIVTLEVLGHPEHSITFHRAMDEDSFCVDGSSVLGTEEHVLLVCVYRNSVKPDALCGTAKIAFRRFIKSGFSGKLPLRTKGDVPLEVFIGMPTPSKTEALPPAEDVTQTYKSEFVLDEGNLEENLGTLDSSPGLSDAVAEQVAELPQALEELDAQEVPEVVVEVEVEDPEPELEDVPAEAAAIPEAKSEPLVVARLDEDVEEQPAEDLPAGAEPTQQTADSAPEAQDPMPQAVVPSETVQVPIEIDDPPEQLAI